MVYRSPKSLLPPTHFILPFNLKDTQLASEEKLVPMVVESNYVEVLQLAISDKVLKVAEDYVGVGPSPMGVFAPKRPLKERQEDLAVERFVVR